MEQTSEDETDENALSQQVNNLKKNIFISNRLQLKNSFIFYDIKKI